jgi:hypothetical protein
LAQDGPVPALLALLVCESVIHDAETQTKTLVRVLSRINAQSVPLQIAGLGLYAKMVEGSGAYSFRIRLVSLKDESQILDMTVPANWSSPESPLEIGANFRGVPIPDFGDYEFQLFGNEVYLGRAVFNVAKFELPAAAPTRTS